MAKGIDDTSSAETAAGREPLSAPLRTWSSTMRDLPRGLHTGLLDDGTAGTREILVGFLRDGLERGERVVWIGPEARPEVLVEAGCDLDEARAAGLTLETDLHDCDLSTLATWIRETAEAARAEGRPGLRVVRWHLGVEALLDSAWEGGRRAALVAALRAAKARLVCAYDTRTLPARALVRAVQCHRFLVHDGALHQNPYYLPPDVEAGPDLHGAVLESWLGYLTRSRSHRERLERRLERSRSVFVTAGDAIIVHEPAGRILDVNEAACELLGRTREELLVCTPDDLEADERGGSYPGRMDRVVSEGHLTFELGLRRGDGRVVEVEVTSRTIDFEGRPAIIAIARDLTARRETEQALRRSEARLRRALAEYERLATAVEQAAEAVFITDTEGAIEYVNPAFERMFGWREDEVVGRNPRLLKSGQQDQPFYADLWGTLLEGRVWRGRLVNRAKSGAIVHIEATISPFHDDDGRTVGFVSLMRDIGRELSLQEQLRHAQKMEAIGRFTGGIAHDFNNLLTVVLSTSAFVSEVLPAADPDVVEALDDMRAAAQRGAELVRRLLVFSRREPLAVRPTDVAGVVHDLKKALSRVIPENIELRIEAPPALPTAAADPGAIEQILANLVTNARDAMPEGGIIRVTLDEASFGPEQGALPMNADAGRYLRMAVEDDGTGMEQTVRERIFDPFFTTKPAGQGTGLGLAVIYGLVEQLSGFLRVDSAPARGSLFEVFLPVAGEAAHAAVHEEEAPAPGGDETVLVVEDEDGLRRSTRRILEGLGYRVLDAVDGIAALELLDGRTPVDLVLTDVIMPRMGGPALRERLLARRPALPVVFMSGYTGPREGDAPDLDPAVPLLTKPWTRETLARIIRDCLDAC